MTKTSAVLGLLLAGLVVLASAAPVHASGHWHGGVYIGVGPWWGPPFWGFPYWWYPPPPYYYPRVVIQQPQVYIEREPPPPPPPPPPAYWYYCRSAQAYYPSVPTCPEEWVKVPPTP